MIRTTKIIRYKDLTEKERKEFTDRFYRCWCKLFNLGDNPAYWWYDMLHGFGYPWEYDPEGEVEEPELCLKRNWKDFVEDNVRSVCNECFKEACDNYGRR